MLDSPGLVVCRLLFCVGAILPVILSLQKSDKQGFANSVGEGGKRSLTYRVGAARGAVGGHWLLLVD
jgi:hypothetical protein